MNNIVKVIVSALLLAIVVSLLWFVMPATPVWAISYIFTLVAIVGIAISFLVYKQKTTRVPQGHAFPITAVSYALISAFFSVITLYYDYNEQYFPAVWYAIIHTAILVIYVIRVIALFVGSEYIEKVGERTEQKHKELNKGKADYWK